MRIIYKFPLFACLIILTLACNNGGGEGNGDNNGTEPLGSGISRDCASQAGLIPALGRSGGCLCDSENRGEFFLSLGPQISSEGGSFLSIGSTFFNAEVVDLTTVSLFNPSLAPDTMPFPEPVGELRDIQAADGLPETSAQFTINFPGGTPEQVVCPACFAGPIPVNCDIEAEVDKPKCLDTARLVETGSACPADAIVRVCEPFVCFAELTDPTGEITIFADFFPVPVESSTAMGCDAIVQGSTTFSGIMDVPPHGEISAEEIPVFDNQPGVGSFSCGFQEGFFEFRGHPR